MREFQPFHYNFDFDEWLVLARTDPNAFDCWRREIIDRAIECTVTYDGDHRRLRGLQCRIDLERMRARTPLKACLRLSDMMWHSFFELKDTFADNLAKPPSPERTATASVIPFRKAPAGD